MSYADHVVAEVEEETGYRKGLLWRPLYFRCQKETIVMVGLTFWVPCTTTSFSGSFSTRTYDLHFKLDHCKQYNIVDNILATKLEPVTE